MAEVYIALRCLGRARFSADAMLSDGICLLTLEQIASFTLIGILTPRRNAAALILVAGGLVIPRIKIGSFFMPVFVVRCDLLKTEEAPMRKVHSMIFASLAMFVLVAPNIPMEKTDPGFQKAGDSRIHNCPPGKVYNQQTKTCK